MTEYISKLLTPKKSTTPITTTTKATTTTSTTLTTATTTTIKTNQIDQQNKLPLTPTKSLIIKSTTILSDHNSQSNDNPSTSLSQSSSQKTNTSSLNSNHSHKQDRDKDQDQDQGRGRKYYILTHAGKPVWSTESDDLDREHGDVTNHMGLIQAIISIFEDDHDQLRYIDVGSVKIAVLSKPPLHFLAVSNWGEPESTLQVHLEYLSLLIHSILSRTQLERVLASRANFDLRGALGGTEMIFEGMVERLQWDLSILVGGLSVYRCPTQIRDRISQLITPVNPSISSLVLYSIVIADRKVISLVRPKNHSVHPSDLQIILTTILSSSRISSSESWIPICLPGYNPTGFVHGYIKFTGKDSVGLVIISKDRGGFYECQSWAEEVLQDPIWIELNYLRNYHNSSSSSSPKLRLESETPLSKEDLDRLNLKFNSSLGNRTSLCGDYSLEDLVIPGLRHFVYKDRKFVQVSFPAWDGDYSVQSNRKRLIVNYQKAFDLIHPKKKSSSNSSHSELPSISTPMKFTFFKNQFESTIGWVTNSYEIYLTISPLLSKSKSILIVHSIVNWIQKIHSEIFLTSINQF